MTRRRRRALAALVAAGALGALAGCGGGGDDGPSAGASAPVVASPSIELPAGDGGASAVAALGDLPPVEEAALDRQLDGFETLGGPHDPFRQQDQEGSEAAAVPADASETAAEASAAAAAVPAAAPAVPLGGAPVTAPAVPTPAVAAPPAPPAPAAADSAPGGAPSDGPAASAPGMGGAAEGPAKRGDAPLALLADLDVSGDALSGAEGDRMPPDAGWFTLQSVDAGRVVLRLEGALLPGGEDTVTLRVGESVTLRAAGGATRRITLIRVRSA